MKFHRAQSLFHFRKLLDSFSVFLDALHYIRLLSLDTSSEIRIRLLSRDQRIVLYIIVLYVVLLRVDTKQANVKERIV